MPRYYERDAERHARRLDRPDAALDRERRSGASRRPGCSTSTSSSCTCPRRRRRGRRRPGRPPRRPTEAELRPATWPAADLARARRSTTTSRSATSAGSSRTSTSTPTGRCSTRSSATRRSGSASTTPGPLLRVAAPPSGPRFIDRRPGARRPRPGRDRRRRLLRADPRVAAGPRPGRPAAPDGATSSRRCSGAGRAARGWRSASGSRTLPTTLAAAGYDWTILDDAHLRAASIPRGRACGARYTTDDQGQRLTVFGTEQGLRYRIPFQPVDDVIEYLPRRTRRDDGRASG